MKSKCGYGVVRIVDVGDNKGSATWNVFLVLFRLHSATPRAGETNSKILGFGAVAENFPLRIERRQTAKSSRMLLNGVVGFAISSFDRCEGRLGLRGWIKEIQFVLTSKCTTYSVLEFLGATAVGFAALGGPTVAQAGNPKGSYQQTCNSITVSGSTLRANCANRNRGWQFSELQDFLQCLGDIRNLNGNLHCDKGASLPNGSYTQSCQDAYMGDNTLHASCKTSGGEWRSTELSNVDQCVGDINNYEGALRCSTAHPERRGLLASPGLEGQAVKGIYFFPGETRDASIYTTHPLIPSDQHWNSDPASRAGIIRRMTAAHVNTLVMSYWSNMPQWSPMALDSTSLPGVLDATQGRPLVIMPTIEGGFDAAHPEIPHWQFSTDFPSPVSGGASAPGLVQRIGQLVELFHGHMELWARIYDRNGDWRYAVAILHVCSDIPGTTDLQFANAFDNVAAQVRSAYGIPIGFMLDVIGGDHAYVAAPPRAGPLLEEHPSVLAVNGFESEVFSGKVINGPPCSDPDWHRCQPHDNNRDNLENLADWKRAAVHDWVVTGLPVILDVSNGFDGRIVWRQNGTGFWGDNMDYTDDRWRNWSSELKGSGAKGIVFDTWNGYTEGYAAVPSQEHGQTVYNWLTDLLEPDPQQCSHMHYVKGVATFRVYGAICEKWVQLGADRGFGAPVTGELASTRGRVSYFADDKAIYWSGSTGAHEVHGLIAKTYWEAGGDASCLGLPTSDEEPSGGSRVSHFEHGQIVWNQGDTLGRITCK